jgi:DNA polymerase-3 subunit gamma/tau
MTVLYRQYRPSKWKEVVGQDHVTNALSSSIENKRIAHAYLFSGGRGIGKTSVARILAQSIGAHDEDVYEIDAASNRGIDNIREIREHVAVLPFSSPYKVYIIDEVHMLSKDAWNALLKTLEEPPKHVVFILATTEIEKVPDTIISRCQNFVFKKPSRDILRHEVAKVAEKEGYKLDSGSADLIAMLGDGSFRDTLGILQKVISASSDKKLTREEVEKITGSPKTALVNDFIENLISKKIDDTLNILYKAEKDGFDIKTFALLILEKLRIVFALQTAPTTATSLQEKISSDDFEFISKLAKINKLTVCDLANFLSAVNDIHYASVEILPLEIGIYKICGKV